MHKRDRTTAILFAALATLFISEAFYSYFSSGGGYVGPIVYGLIAVFYIVVTAVKVKKLRTDAKNKEQAL